MRAETCHKSDVFAVITEMSEFDGGSIAALVEVCQDLHSHVVDNRVNAAYVADRLRKLARAVDRY